MGGAPLPVHCCDEVPLKHWYTIQCKPREEARAEANLDRQGYRTFRPLIRRPIRRGGRRTAVTESLFPRYLFAQLCEVAENWAPIRSTRGVLGLVRFGSSPVPVPEPVIEGIRLRLDPESGCLDLTRDSDFAPQQPVTITDGPFQGREALFLARTGEERVIVLMQIMSQCQQVELPAAAVGPVI